MRKNHLYKPGIVGQLFAVLWMLSLSSVAQAEEGKPYLIHAGDVLGVTVWKEEDLKAEALVRPDGRFSFALAGDIQAAGRSVEDVQAELKKKIEPYIPDAVVTVVVLKIIGNTAYVVGKVNKPGAIVMNIETDVMQALSIAGGTSTFAKLKKIKILRRAGSQQTAIPFNYDAVEDGEQLEQNIVLQPGDVVVVP